MADLLTDKLRHKLDNKQGINLMIITFDFKDLVTLPSIKYLKSDSITAILVLGWTLFVWLVKIREEKVKILLTSCSNAVPINLIFQKTRFPH